MQKLNLAGKVEAGTKVGPPVRVGSTQIDSDQLGSNKKKKKIIKLDSDQLGVIKKIKLNQQN